MLPIILVVLIFLIFLALVYNSLVSLNNRTREAWSDIDVQLKRKYDLIPKIQKTVEGYVKHEQKTLKELTEARTKALSAKSISAKSGLDIDVSKSLFSLLAVAENYPKLQASSNFIELQEELANTENIIASARRFYNGNVRDINTKIESFPTNLVAIVFSFKKWDFFQNDIFDK